MEWSTQISLINANFVLFLIVILLVFRGQIPALCSQNNPDHSLLCFPPFIRCARGIMSPISAAMLSVLCLLSRHCSSRLLWVLFYSFRGPR